MICNRFIRFNKFHIIENNHLIINKRSRHITATKKHINNNKIHNIMKIVVKVNPKKIIVNFVGSMLITQTLKKMKIINKILWSIIY
jgi:hypothetical protein